MSDLDTAVARRMEWMKEYRRKEKRSFYLPEIFHQPQDILQMAEAVQEIFEQRFEPWGSFTAPAS